LAQLVIAATRVDHSESVSETDMAQKSRHRQINANVLTFPSSKKTAQADPSAAAPVKHPKRLSNDKKWSYNVLPTSTPLVSELMASCLGAAPLCDGQALIEAGVLAFRCRKNGEPEILLVSRRRSKKWGIPKGRVEPHLNFSELAAQEAFEEAGVVGYISPNSVGMFRERRRSKTELSRQIIEVWVYLFKVTKTLGKWPEMQKRQSRWASCQIAAEQLREPMLVHLCHWLAQHGSKI
jgi:8-oxo-dGTP pyrophosphatase MutT (NUDIX family)